MHQYPIHLHAHDLLREAAQDRLARQVQAASRSARAPRPHLNLLALLRRLRPA
ncbi:hypothetical protein GO986_19290 [Deinococcus sp. HMF7620]|uniref:Uncharacterized protein n=1 Tax=Deinococcus arboris TaxID=2682977 RepID=A0A7C9I172_9DEIO|nr:MULTISPECIES: hypothetical protein [Deinococcus]MBZ9751126.1 hypothetical protein [Deinococcus betulae]MVN88890.1 hypothetical protein [Deinococcus arboris]